MNARAAAAIREEILLARAHARGGLMIPPLPRYILRSMAYARTWLHESRDKITTAEAEERIRRALGE